MPMESHEKAAEFHELATQAHSAVLRTAGKKITKTGLDHCKKSLLTRAARRSKEKC